MLVSGVQKNEPTIHVYILLDFLKNYDGFITVLKNNLFKLFDILSSFW